jgi:hypothetical protein
MADSIVSKAVYFNNLWRLGAWRCFRSIGLFGAF